MYLYISRVLVVAAAGGLVKWVYNALPYSAYSLFFLYILLYNQLMAHGCECDDVDNRLAHQAALIFIHHVLYPIEGEEEKLTSHSHGCWESDHFRNIGHLWSNQ